MRFHYLSLILAGALISTNANAAPFTLSITGKVAQPSANNDTNIDTNGIFRETNPGDAFTATFNFDTETTGFSNTSALGTTYWFQLTSASLKIGQSILSMPTTGYQYIQYGPNYGYNQTGDQASFLFNYYVKPDEIFSLEFSLHSEDATHFPQDGSLLSSGTKSLKLDPGSGYKAQTGAVRGYANNAANLYLRLNPETLEIAAVPEPATWALMLAGFGMVGFAIRRKSAHVALS